MLIEKRSLTSLRVPSHLTLASPPGPQITSIGRVCTSPCFELLATSELEMIWMLRPPVAVGWLERGAAGGWLADELAAWLLAFLLAALLAVVWLLAGSILRGLLGL